MSEGFSFSKMSSFKLFGQHLSNETCANKNLRSKIINSDKESVSHTEAMDSKTEGLNLSVRWLSDGCLSLKSTIPLVYRVRYFILEIVLASYECLSALITDGSTMKVKDSVAPSLKRLQSFSHFDNGV